MPAKKDPDIDLRPQADNVNRHTERGLAALEESVREDGWIGAITIAADGESFDGSARMEKGFELGLRPKIVDIEGDEMLIGRRKDIPTATDDRARRLGIAANRIAQLDYDPDPHKLALASQEGLLSTLQFSGGEIEAMLLQIASPPALPSPGDGGDDFDTTTSEGPTRAHRGDIWRIGDHTLMCGDCRSEADMKTLMHERVASLMIADPPYNVGKDYGDGTDDFQDPKAYEEFTYAWFPLWRQSAYRTIVTPGGQNLHTWDKLFVPLYIAPWIKLNAMTHGRVSAFWVWEPLLFFGEHWKRDRANDVFNHRVTEQKFLTGESLSPMHPCPKPLSLWLDLVESYTDYADLVVDPMAGTGTLLVAAHRLGRQSLCMEISPAYCDVILSRALAEGIGPIERVGGAKPKEVLQPEPVEA